MQTDSQEKPRENSIFNNLPFRGNRIDRKENDPESKQPKLSYAAHARILKLDDEEDLKEYIRVWNETCKGNCQIGIEERQYDPEKKTWVVLLRWVELFYTDNPK